MNANKPKDFNEYIASFPEETQIILEEIRTTIQKSAPDAVEKISYGMPAFAQNGNLVYFAAHKNHIGFYATPKGNEAFQKEISIYKVGKGSIQFPIDKPMPLKLIAEMVKFRVIENLDKKRK